jgi:hypothetical protein
MRKVTAVIVAFICMGLVVSGVSAGTYKAYTSKKVPSKEIIEYNFTSLAYPDKIFAKYYGLHKIADNSYVLYFNYDHKQHGTFHRSQQTGSLIRLENNDWLIQSKYFLKGFQVLRMPKEKK